MDLLLARAFLMSMFIYCPGGRGTLQRMMTFIKSFRIMTR